MNSPSDLEGETASDCRRSPFPAAYTNRTLYLVKEYLAVPNFSGVCGFLDGVDRLFENVLVDDQFQLYLGQKVDGVFPAPEDLGMAFLPAMPADFRNRHAIHADIDQRGFYVFELAGLNDGFDLRHSLLSHVSINRQPGLSAHSSSKALSLRNRARSTLWVCPPAQPARTRHIPDRPRCHVREGRGLRVLPLPTR